MWVYILKEKAETLEKFNELKEMMEKQSDYHIMVLSPDLGGEYTLKVINNFNKQCVVIYQLIVAYLPQQNGIIECRTILNMARSI